MLMNIFKVIASLLFLMLGADKFLHFLEPPCSLEQNISQNVWIVIGYIYFGATGLIWHPRFGKQVAAFFAVLMLFFVVYHLVNNTYDIGGALLMAVLLGFIAWNPSFLSRKSMS